MGMTMAEKILARHSGKEEVRAGEFVTADVDRVMVHEMLAFMIEIYERHNIPKKVWDPDRVVMLMDHYVPAPTVDAAEMHRKMREFARETGLKINLDGKEGICHQIMPELGYVKPGDLILGTDSHTTTYGAFGAASTGIGATEMIAVFATGKLWFRVPETIKFEIEGSLQERVGSKDVILDIAGTFGSDVAQYRSVEFHGSAVEEMSISSRMVLSNMSVEIGAKFGIIPPDKKTIEFVESVTDEPFTPVYPDDDAIYEAIHELSADELEPKVALPHSVDNVKSVGEVSGIKIDQGFIGSCTNGRLEDLEIAAEILEGNEVHRDVRLIISPASRRVYRSALEKGLIDIFLDAKAIVCNPTCGPCWGGHLGLLGKGERCISSSNRNFKGRMGHEESEIYLASPATVAASCIRGEITDPRYV